MSEPYAAQFLRSRTHNTLVVAVLMRLLHWNSSSVRR